MPFNRKFADIEAANNRLASALYLKDEEKKASSLSAEDIAEQSDGSALDVSPQAEAVASAGGGAPPNPRDGDSSGEELGNLRKPQPCRGESKAAQHQQPKTPKLAEIPSASSWMAYLPGAQACPPNSPPETASNASASQTAQPASGFVQFSQHVETSPAGSPGLGPLSPEPCDLSVWMFSDSSTCTQGQKSIAELSESQWSEIVDLLSASSPDRAYAEVEACLESICACSGAAGQDVESAERAFADLFDSFTENPGEPVFEGWRLHGETCEYMYEDGHGCQEVTQRQNGDGPEAAHLGVEQQLPASFGYRSNGLELQACQHPKGEGPCSLGSKPHLTPFEGVAQSFTVPLHYSRLRAIPALPREEDWPFTDILEDRASMYG